MIDYNKIAIDAIYDALHAKENPPIDPPVEPPVEPPVSGDKYEFEINELTGLFQAKINTVEVIGASFSFWSPGWDKWYGLSSEVNKTDVYEITGSVEALGLTANNRAFSVSDTQFQWDISLNSTKMYGDIPGGCIEFFCDTNKALLLDNGFEIDGFRVTFTEPLASLEINGAKAIRAFFYRNTLEIGDITNKMIVELPEGTRILTPIVERLGGPPDETWPTEFNLEYDLSYLNDHVAGSRGFVEVIGDKLYLDGERFKAWGMNLSAYSLFSTTNDAIAHHARRMAQLGVNLVRIHHHDSNWVNPNIFLNRDSTLELSDISLEKLDQWVEALKTNGIYIWFDLHVGREFKEGEIDNYAEAVNKDKRAYGFCYIDQSIRDRMKEFNEQYVNHINTISGIAYKDDPAIVTWLITNENDLTAHFGGRLDDLPVSTNKYLTLAAEWGATRGYPENENWAWWRLGAPKRFLCDLEYNFNVEMDAHLKSLGVQQNVVTTHRWGNMPMYSEVSMTYGDIVDCHSYGKPGFLSTNPKYKEHIGHWIAASQVNGKPFSISEWNIETVKPYNANPYPDNFDRVIAGLYLSAMGCLHDWDIPIHFGYSGVTLNGDQVGKYDGFNDPATLALFQAAALMFRQGHVSKANNTYAIPVNFDTGTSPANSVAIRTLAEKSRLVLDIEPHPDLPWFTPAPLGDDVIKITDLNEDFAESDSVIASDNGQIMRNYREGFFIIDTPNTKAFAGWTENALAPFEFYVPHKYIGITVQSVDGLPTELSNKLLISVGTRSYPTHIIVEKPTMTVKKQVAPYHTEPISGQIRFKASQGFGHPYENGMVTIDLTGHYLVLG